MRKFAKIAGIVAAVCVALLVALAVLARILITPERVKKTVIPLAEKALHRPLTLGEVKISIFSGIVLEKLVIGEREGKEPFVTAERVKLKYQFWPLLARRVVVDQVQLDSPHVRVVRLPDGTFNFTDITTRKEPAPEAKREPGTPIDLLVSKVGVTGGQLRFEDRKQKEAPFVITATDIAVTSNDVSRNKPFPFTAKAKIPGVSTEVEGTADLTTKPAIDATVRVAAELGPVVAALPPQLALKAKRFSPTGGIDARLRLAGAVSAPKQLLKEGEVKLKDLQVTASGQRPVLQGDLTLTADSVTSKNLTVALGENRLKIEFAAANILSKPVSVTSTVTADKFDLDPFLKKGQAPVPAPGAAGGEKPEPGPIQLPVKAAGTVQLGQTAYKGLPITKLNLKYRLADNVLTIDSLTGNVAGGSFSDTARVDLTREGLAYSTRLNVTGVQAEQVIPAFAPKAAGTVFGTLSLNADLGGAGTKPAAAKKSLSGRGDFTITGGKLTGAGLVQELAQFVNIEKLRVLQFSRFAGSFRIDRGKVAVDSGVAGNDVKMTPRGTVGLDKSLDLSLDTRLSPDITRQTGKGDIGRYLADENGWTILPLKVTGTLSSPSFRLDSAAVREQVKSKAREKLQQTIEEKLLKKKEGEPQRPERELLERGLKGIFGR